MIIYVVLSGEQGEGGHIHRVFTSKDAAIKCATAQEPIFDGGWKQSSDDSLYWENGCDYVMVSEYEVESEYTPVKGE